MDRKKLLQEILDLKKKGRALSLLGEVLFFAGLIAVLMLFVFYPVPLVIFITGFTAITGLLFDGIGEQLQDEAQNKLRDLYF